MAQIRVQKQRPRRRRVREESVDRAPRQDASVRASGAKIYKELALPSWRE